MYLSFKDAREFVRNQRLKNQKEWNKWIKGNSKNYMIPSNPNIYYDSWVSFSDWLESGVESFKNREYYEYEYCKILLKDKKFNNRKEFYEFTKTNIDNKIPKRPDHVYKKQNKWEGWQTFLSIEKTPPIHKSNLFLSYDDAKKFISSIKFTQQSEYINYIMDNNIEFLPKRPDYVYKNNWKGYLDFLGCETNRKSFGERKIKEFLDQKSIFYIRENKFKNCKNIKELPFDFYLPDYNICIEYDGELSSKIFGGDETLNRIKKNDKIKDNWCSENNIKLIRISYKKKNKIFKILNIEIN
jgi:very-short-patch-repair endonuclease